MTVFDFLIDFARQRGQELNGGIFGNVVPILELTITLVVIIAMINYWKRKQRKAIRLMNQIEQTINSFQSWLRRHL